MISSPRRKTVPTLDIILGMILLAGAVWLAYRINVAIDYDWKWQSIPQYFFRFDAATGKWTSNLILQGFFTTVRLSIWATILALVIGTVMGMFRSGSGLFKRLVGGTYVELTRNIPPLVLIFIFYYFVSSRIMPFLGIEDCMRDLSGGTRSFMSVCFAPPERFPAFLSALVTLAIFEGAYITEIVRAGIQSVEKGQHEASAALGFSWRQRMRHVILPQAFRRILPPLAGQFISTIKDSAIVSAISIPELTFQGMELMSSTYLTFEIWITITLLYLALTLSCSLAASRLEKRFRIP